VSPDFIAILASLPWIALPMIAAVRLRKSRSVDEFPANAGPAAALISVIIPARNEASNIERCVRSVLATTWPELEVIVVDDESTDGTHAILTALQREDPRLLVFNTPPLPRGWFGKQWACWTGAARARGDILCFTDADTTHGPELLVRCVNAMTGRDADLFSIVGRQEMVTIWEKLIQPQIFAMLNLWYGGTETVTRSRHSWRKIANGQFLMMSRAVYDATGGHEAVKHSVAEDLMLAQRFHSLGRRVVFMEARDHFSTRMYRSLRELIAGWGKNVFAGGVNALPPVPLIRLFFPFLLLAPALMELAPALLLPFTAAGLLPAPVLLWAIIAFAATLLTWMVIHLNDGESPLLGLLHPVGAMLTLFILTRAILRGRNVSWKGRAYRST
jgi:chlorobactene glucosyltransferase